MRAGLFFPCDITQAPMPSQPGPHSCPEHSYQIELILVLVFETSRLRQGLTHGGLAIMSVLSFYQTNKQNKYRQTSMKFATPRQTETMDIFITRIDWVNESGRLPFHTSINQSVRQCVLCMYVWTVYLTYCVTVCVSCFVCIPGPIIGSIIAPDQTQILLLSSMAHGVGQGTLDIGWMQRIRAGCSRRSIILACFLMV